MTVEDRELTLLNVCEGKAEALFNRELQAVIDNMADVNTDAQAVREVTLKVRFKPNLKREMAQMDIQATSKLAPFSAHTSVAWLGKDATGRAVAIGKNPNQKDFDFGAEGVDSINKKQKEGTHD